MEKFGSGKAHRWRTGLRDGMWRSRKKAVLAKNRFNLRKFGMSQRRQRQCWRLGQGWGQMAKRTIQSAVLLRVEVLFGWGVVAGLLAVVVVVVKDEMVQAHPSPKRHIDAREHRGGNLAEYVACFFHAKFKGIQKNAATLGLPRSTFLYCLLQSHIKCNVHIRIAGAARI